MEYLTGNQIWVLYPAFKEEITSFITWPFLAD